jgi:hypothetical protein
MNKRATISQLLLIKMDTKVKEWDEIMLVVVTEKIELSFI